MHFQRRYFLLTAAVVFLLCKICSASLLGIASDYSAFTFGPIELERSDAGGGIAGAGNITLDSYSTGRGRESSQYTVISDGSVTCVNGIVYNGGLFAGNNTELPPHYLL